jgi:hypothetical protein
MKNAFKIVVRKPERKRPLQRPRHKFWIFKETVCELVDWVYIVQDRIQ